MGNRRRRNWGDGAPQDDDWAELSRIYRRAMGLAQGRKSGTAEVDKSRERPGLNTAEALAGKGKS